MSDLDLFEDLSKQDQDDSLKGLKVLLCKARCVRALDDRTNACEKA